MKTVLIGALCSLIAAVLGAVIGAFTVHWLTRSREHRAWVRDSRIKEWQELPDTLTKAYTALLSYPPEMKHPVAALEGRRGILADVDTVLSTRIFIEDDISELTIRTKWAALLSDYRGGVNKPVFQDRFQGLRRAIVEAAKQTTL